ncbi:unknown [Clostridium sp. CAG:575]|nr:unknown [Clostridium sp. CAG:575]
MDRMKTFLKYILAIIIFFFFSNFLIYMSLETTYQNIGRKDNLQQVTIYQAQATKVNGRIKGTIYNDANNKITDRYLKIDLYSERGNLLGTKYIDLLGIRENETRNLEVYFKIQDVDYYEISFTKEKEEQEELPEMVKDLTKEQVVWGTFLTFLIFW